MNNDLEQEGTALQDNASATSDLPPPSESHPEESAPPDAASAPAEPSASGDGQPLPPYTEEELRQEQFERIDPRRLPPGIHREIYRNMQAGLTRKFQELAETKRQLVEPAPQRTLFEEYQADPERVITFLDAKIGQAQQDDPSEALNLLKIKTDLLARKQLDQARETRQDRVETVVRQWVREHVPDFEAKGPLVEKLWGQKGRTREALARLTDPARQGPDAGELVVFLTQMYGDLVKTLPRHERQTPTAGERPGPSRGERSGEKSPSDMSYAEYKRWRMEQM